MGKGLPAACGGCPVGCYCEISGGKDTFTCYNGGMGGEGRGATCECAPLIVFLAAAALFAASVVVLCFTIRRVVYQHRLSACCTPDNARRMVAVFAGAPVVLLFIFFIVAVTTFARLMSARVCEPTCFWSYPLFITGLAIGSVLTCLGLCAVCVSCRARGTRDGDHVQLAAEHAGAT